MSSTSSTWLRRLVVGALGAGVLWLAFTFYLDMRYDRFPEVSRGGLMILAAGYAALGVVAASIALIAKLLRRR